MPVFHYVLLQIGYITFRFFFLKLYWFLSNWVKIRKGYEKNMVSLEEQLSIHPFPPLPISPFAESMGKRLPNIKTLSWSLLSCIFSIRKTTRLRLFNTTLFYLCNLSPRWLINNFIFISYWKFNQLVTSEFWYMEVPKFLGNG